LAIIVGTMLFTIFAVVVSSSSRLWPGRSAPPETVITAISTSAQSLASRVEMVIIPGR
jgi:outer membrane murein-binding lipoprotein Lpp